MPEPSQFVELPRIGRVCRLGLATRGNTQLEPDDVMLAIDRGVNYLNWCGHPDGMRDCIRQLGDRRQDVCIAVQFSARTATAAAEELDWFLTELDTDYIDVVTYYYVEHQSEWEQIIAHDGASTVLEKARDTGTIRSIGLTSHQRRLAGRAIESGRLDLIMVRYNAAHRSAEGQVFPIARKQNVPVVAFTCLRWGALLQPTAGDPPEYTVATAAEWYRFVLCQPDIAVALMAPNGLDELTDNLWLLENWHGLSVDELQRMRAHGDRVYRTAGEFP